MGMVWVLSLTVAAHDSLQVTRDGQIIHTGPLGPQKVVFKGREMGPIIFNGNLGEGEILL